MSIEVMKQAIEAFEELKREVTRDGTVSENWDAYYAKEYHALEALRKAVEQAEKQEPKRDKPLRLSPMYEYGHIHDAELPWVGLNWDDIPDVFVGDISFFQGANWAQAKLKEKNGGS